MFEKEGSRDRESSLLMCYVIRSIRAGNISRRKDQVIRKGNTSELDFKYFRKKI